MYWSSNMGHGDIVYSECLYRERHGGEEPPCVANCHIDCENHLLLYEDGYSCYGNEKPEE